jgi:predicted AAA+ superfamily ATPase
MTTYKQRDLASLVSAALENMPVVVITGMRQAGKTTFLQNQPGLGQRRYLTFDDFPQLAAAKSDPDGFVRSEEPLTIDEAHKCPEIFTAVKRAVDKRRRPGHFLLSGSANFALLKSIRESLAGRALYLQMRPFSRRELSGEISERPFLERFFQTQKIPKGGKSKSIHTEDVLTGGMPAVCLGEVKNRNLWFKGYEQTYLERDLREISQVENLMALRDLLHLTALRTGQLLSPSQLGRDAKLSAATTSRYLSLLETSFIITRLNPYLRNKASRIIKTPKLYLNDSGLACYFAGLDRFESGSGGPLIGALFETYVAQNLMNIIDSVWPEAHLYFWTIQGRQEVDFIIEAGRSCLALEIKWGAKWQERDLAGLKAFLASTPHCKGAILGYNGGDAVQLGEKLWALPISLVLS